MPDEQSPTEALKLAHDHEEALQSGWLALCSQLHHSPGRSTGTADVIPLTLSSMPLTTVD